MALDVSAYKTLPTAVFDGPKNPGGPKNNMEKPKEEETMEPKNTITTAEALAAAYPDLVNSIKDAAAKNERERIKGIMDSTLDGYEDVAKDAMFENPINAGDFALKITAAERQAKAALPGWPGRRCQSSGRRGSYSQRKRRGNHEYFRQSHCRSIISERRR